MNNVRVILLFFAACLSGCNVLWGPSDGEGGWPFSPTSAKVFEVRNDNGVPPHYPKTVRVSKEENTVKWVANFGTGEVYEGVGSIRLLGEIDGSKTYGFSASIPKQFTSSFSATSERAYSVYGLVKEIGSGTMKTYTAALVQCGLEEVLKTCEAKSTAEAWRSLESADTKLSGAVPYTLLDETLGTP